MESNLLQKYREWKKQFPDTSFLPDDIEIKTVLRQAVKHNPITSLMNLCNNDERKCFHVLQLFLTLHIARNIDDRTSNAKRSKRNQDRDIINYGKRLIKESADHIELVGRLDTDIDTGRLHNKALEWVEFKTQQRIYGVDKKYEAIDFVCRLEHSLNRQKLMEKARQDYMDLFDVFGADIWWLDSFLGKESKGSKKHSGPEFNKQLFKIYKTTTGNLQDIANLLNSLNIKTATGKMFTRQSVKSLLK